MTSTFLRLRGIWDIAWNRSVQPYATKSLSVVLLDEISIKHLNVDRVLSECVFLKLTCTVYHVVNVVKCGVVYNIL